MNIEKIKSIEHLINQVKLPKMFAVRQLFPSNALDLSLIEKIVRVEISNVLIDRNCIYPGMKVAITAGSRMISNSVAILKTLVEFVKEKGASPFLVPAMGSHGGATAQGQLEVLSSLGITEDSIGCPIYSSMETVCIGKNDLGEDTYIDRYASEADGIIVFNRIKPHSGFHGRCESGLVKMLAVGLGKQIGASRVHAKTGKGLGESIYYFGKKILETEHILFGLAVIEDAYDQTAEIHAVKPEEILETDPIYRQRALSMMPRILFTSCDALIVNTIGKNICGSGMDNNIIGKFHNNMFKGWIESEMIGVLNISSESHGNANGIGRANVISKRVLDEIDLASTYANAITTKCYSNVSLPMTMRTDELVFKACVNGCKNIKDEQPRIIFIQDTLHLKKIWLSEWFWDEVKNNDRLVILTNPKSNYFDNSGNVTLSF